MILIEPSFPGSTKKTSFTGENYRETTGEILPINPGQNILTIKIYPNFTSQELSAIRRNRLGHLKVTDIITLNNYQA